MKIHSRTAALAASLALVATVAALRHPPASDIEVSSASLDPLSFLHVQEQEGESVDPQSVGQGETAAEAERYEGEHAGATAPPQWQAIDAHNNATRGPRQPIPFSHRFHAGELQIDCMYCHTGTERSVTGVVPVLEVCMGCHLVAGTGLPPIEDLRGYSARGEPIPWQWVNKLPEFVQFNHQPHLRTGLECQECHGPVEEMDRVYQWAPLTMGWCLECHRRSPVDSDVSTDHALSQINPPPQPPEQRQDGSFYPRAIDTHYGQTRAPTDCAACHY